MKKIILVLFAFFALQSSAQGTLGSDPFAVNASDAQVKDIGGVFTNMYQWAVEDPQTHKIDTVYTTEQFILWQKDGDIEEQAERIRARAPLLPEELRWITPQARTEHIRLPCLRATLP